MSFSAQPGRYQFGAVIPFTSLHSGLSAVFFYPPTLPLLVLKFPELNWLDRHHWVPTVVCAAMLLTGGVAAFVWGFAGKGFGGGRLM